MHNYMFHYFGCDTTKPVFRVFDKVKLKPISLATPVVNLDVLYYTVKVENTWTSSRENLSLGFPSKWDSNQSHQLQRLARKLKFRL